MARVIITFELTNPAQNSEYVVRTIKTYEWVRVCSNSYLIFTEQPPKDIRDRISTMLNPGDIVFVSVYTPPAAWSGLPDSFTTWILGKKIKEVT